VTNIQAKNGSQRGGVVTSLDGLTGATTSSGGAALTAASDAETETGTSTTKAVTPASGAATYLKKSGGTLTGALVGTLSTMTTAIRAGAANWSSTGAIRMAADAAMNWRNNANNADVGGISLNASDQLQLATTTVPDTDNTKSLGASAKRWATVVTTALITGGTSPAVSGAVRLNNNTGMVGRNAANNADVAIIGINASDKAEVGTDLVGSSDALRTLGSSAVRWAGLHLANFVAVGTNPSSSGAVRLANNSGIASRNAANNADVSLLALNASDVATVGAPLTSTGEIIGTRFAPSTATGATAAARYFRATASGAPASGTWVTGDVVPAQDGTFWHCTAGGTPGTWVQSGSATYVTPDEALFQSQVFS